MKEHPNHKGYFITEDGRVFSNKRGQLLELKCRVNEYGYSVVRLCLSGKSISKKVHRLVAETYIPNPDNLPQVNHKDENKLNNNVSNLEWCDSQYNTEYSCCRWIWEIENIKTGQIIEVINFKKYTRENNLDPGALFRTSTGERNHHKNFRIISKTQFK